MRPDIFQTTKHGVYLDNAATTMMDDAVREAMLPYLEESFGNPETPYRLGQEAAEAVALARESVAELLGAVPEEVFFTSGGTEANNWAIREGSNGPPLCSAVEHPSVLRPVACCGGDVIPVDGYGTVNLDLLAEALATGKYGLVSIQYANNEVGTIQPVQQIAESCLSADTLLHVDAVQAFGKVPLDVTELGADMVTVCAHKIHGPKGIGALWVKKGVVLPPFMLGGGQENGARSGTMPVPLVVGFGKACELARGAMRKTVKNMAALAKTVESELALSVGARRNGNPIARLDSILSLTIPGVEATMVAAILDRQYTICVSCGAACSARKGESHVLQAMGFSKKERNETLRVSFGRFTDASDVNMLTGGIAFAVRDAMERGLE